MNPFLFQIEMSVPSPKMILKTFVHQHNAPRLLNSTADYGRQSYFEHFGVLLDVDQGHRSIICQEDSSYIPPFLLCHRYTGHTPCNIGIVRNHRSLTTCRHESVVLKFTILQFWKYCKKSSTVMSLIIRTKLNTFHSGIQILWNTLTIFPRKGGV